MQQQVANRIHHRQDLPPPEVQQSLPYPHPHQYPYGLPYPPPFGYPYEQMTPPVRQMPQQYQAQYMPHYPQVHLMPHSYPYSSMPQPSPVTSATHTSGNEDKVSTTTISAVQKEVPSKAAESQLSPQLQKEKKQSSTSSRDVSSDDKYSKKSTSD